MMKIDVSPRAYQDLTDIKLYISNKLANPDTAKKILTDIIDALHSLTEMHIVINYTLLYATKVINLILRASLK